MADCFADLPSPASSSYLPRLCSLLSSLPPNTPLPPNLPSILFPIPTSSALGDSLLCHLYILRLTAPTPRHSPDQLVSVFTASLAFIKDHKKSPTQNHDTFLKLLVSSAVLLPLLDIDASLVGSVLEHFLLATLNPPRLPKLHLSDVIDLINAVLTQCEEHEDTIVAAIMRPFALHDADYITERPLDKFTKQAKLEQEALRNIVALNDPAHTVFRKAFWKYLELFPDEEDEDADDETTQILQDKADQVARFTTVFAKIAQAAPEFLADEEAYLESMLIFPDDEARLKMVRTISHYLLHTDLPPAKLLQLTLALLARGNDKTTAVRATVSKHCVLLLGREPIEGVDAVSALMDRLVDVDGAIRAATIEEIAEAFWEEDYTDRFPDELVLEVCNRMRDRKETVRDAAQRFVADFLGRVFEKTHAATVAVVEHLLAALMTVPDEVRAAEDKTRVLVLLERVVLGAVDVKVLNNSAQLQTILHTRAARTLKVLRHAPMEAVRRFFAFCSSTHADAVKLAGLLVAWDASKTASAEAEAITFIARILPLPNVEAAKKTAKRILDEYLVKSAVKLFQQNASDDQTFKEHYQAITKLDDFLVRKKPARIATFGHALVERITTVPLHREVLREALSDKRLASSIKPFLQELATTNPHLFAGNVALCAALLRAPADRPALLHVLAKTHAHVPAELATPAFSEELFAACIPGEPTETKNAVFLLHTLYDDKDAMYYDTLFSAAVRSLLEAEDTTGAAFVALRMVLKFKPSYAEREDCRELVSAVMTQIIPDIITERLEEDLLPHLIRFLKGYLLSTGATLRVAPPSDHVVHYLIKFATTPTDADQPEFAARELRVRGAVLGLLLRVVRLNVYDSLFAPLDFYALCRQIVANPPAHPAFLATLHKALPTLPLRYFIIPAVLLVAGAQAKLCRSVLARAIKIRRMLYQSRAASLPAEKLRTVIPEYAFQHLLSYLAHAAFFEVQDFTGAVRAIETMVDGFVANHPDCIPLLQAQISAIKTTNDALAGKTAELQTAARLAELVMNDVTKGKSYSTEEARVVVSAQLFAFRGFEETKDLLPYGYTLPKKSQRELLVEPPTKRKKAVVEEEEVPMEIEEEPNEAATES